MGIYTGNIFNDYSTLTVDAAEGYEDADFSAQVAMIEGHENNLKLFEGGIVSDIQEAAMRINGVDDGELIFFSENVLTDMLGKIKSMLMKLWAKIKAIFKGFMARIDSVFMKSGKSLVNKYKSVILKKDMTDFEAKWRRPKGANHGIADRLGKFEQINSDNEISLDMANHMTNPAKELEKWDDDKVQEKILKQTITGASTIDLGEYEKDFMDSLFEDEDVDDKIDINDIMTELTTFKDTKKGCEKANSSLNKSIADMIKQIDKDHNEFTKERPGLKDGYWTGSSRGLKTASFSSWERDETKRSRDANWANSAASSPGLIQDTVSGGPSSVSHAGSDKDTVDKYGKALQIVSKLAHAYQTCATKFTAAVMKAFKFHNSQLRRVFAKAVAYNRKKDESVMMEAFADLVEYEGDVVEEAGKSKKKKKDDKKVKSKKGKRISDEVDDGDMDVEEESYNFLANIEFK